MKNAWLFLMFLPFNLHSQHISGTIKDIHTGNGIEYAPVMSEEPPTEQ